MPSDPILQRIVPVLAEVPGVAAIALGGSRARGTAMETSDYDIGLYYPADKPLDTDRLLQAVRTFADAPDAAQMTPIGGWGRWIVGGGWPSVDIRRLIGSAELRAALAGLRAIERDVKRLSSEKRGSTK